MAATPGERRYDLDWLRVIGMGAVFTFHILMFVNGWGWHVKNLPQVAAFNLFSEILIPWLMPLFYVISGIGAFYALQRRSNGAFVRERLVRLGVPLLLAIFLLSPHQVYIERLTGGRFDGSFLQFLPHYFEGWYAITPDGNFAWMGLHLWYVFFLLLFSFLTLPFIRQGARKGLWERVGEGTGAAGLLLLPAVLLLALRLVLDPDGAGVGNSGWPMLLYLTFYIYGYSLFRLERFRTAVRTYGTALIAAAVAFTALFLTVDLEVPFGLTGGWMLLCTAWVGAAWFGLLALFHVADRFLSGDSAGLRYANAAVMPVYVLHQPVIVLLGFWLRGVAMAPAAKFFLLYLLAFAVTMGLYHFVVRPFGAVQFLMGVKPAVRRAGAAAAVLLLLLTAAAPPARAASGPWEWVHPYPQSSYLFAIAYGGGQFVAVGENGTIVTSPDGLTWNVQDSGTLEGLSRIAYGGGRFVAVGLHDAVLTSSDGVTWTRIRLPEGAGLLTDVTYGNGIFLALASSGWATSADGNVWKYRPWTQVDSWKLRRVAFGAGQFVVAGQSSVMLSADGVSWTEHLTGSPEYVWDLTHTGDRFALLVSGGVLTSADGRRWEQGPLARGVAGAEGLGAGGGRLVAVGSKGTVFTAVEGGLWQNVSPPADAVPEITQSVKAGLKAVAYGNGLYVAVGGQGIIFRSADGTQWEAAHRGSFATLTAVDRGAGRYIAVGDGGTMLTATNGRTWSPVQTGDRNWLRGVRFLNGSFLAMGANATLLRSGDGLQWERLTVPSPQTLWDAAYSGGVYVVVGQNGAVLRSANGRTWTAHPQARDLSFLAVTHGAGRFVAVGQRVVETSATSWYPNRVIAASEDGLLWRIVHEARGNALQSVAYGSGRFVAVEENGTSVTSPDGLEWTSSQTPGGPHHLLFDGAMFVGSGHRHYMVSGDGLRWTAAPLPTDSHLGAVAHSDGQYLLAGSRGTVLLAGGRATGCGGLFPDVTAIHPACPAIESLAARKVVGGYPDGTFQPHRTLTRAEAAKLLAAARGWAPQPGGSASFPDAAGHWAAAQGYVQAAVARQAMQGFPDGTFRPDEPVTRAQLIKMAAAAANLQPTPYGGSRYFDLRSEHWAAGPVGAALAGRLIGDGAAYPLWTGQYLNPDLPLTRAEAAMLLANLPAN